MPDFDEVAALLTDGMDNLFVLQKIFRNGSSVAVGASELELFGGDFADSRIDAIALRLDAIGIVDGLQRIEGRLSIVGKAVPEPLQTGLLGLGLVLLSLARLARRDVLSVDAISGTHSAGPRL